jgi:hypothetical protein
LLNNVSKEALVKAIVESQHAPVDVTEAGWQAAVRAFGVSSRALTVTSEFA